MIHYSNLEIGYHSKWVVFNQFKYELYIYHHLCVMNRKEEKCFFVWNNYLLAWSLCRSSVQQSRSNLGSNWNSSPSSAVIYAYIFFENECRRTASNNLSFIAHLSDTHRGWLTLSFNWKAIKKYMHWTIRDWLQYI
jgi:hypothetical protein